MHSQGSSKILLGQCNFCHGLQRHHELQELATGGQFPAPPLISFRFLFVNFFRFFIVFSFNSLLFFIFWASATPLEFIGANKIKNTAAKKQRFQFYFIYSSQGIQITSSKQRCLWRGVHLHQLKQSSVTGGQFSEPPLIFLRLFFVSLFKFFMILC